MVGPFQIEVLNAQHERKNFSCGVEALDRYFRQQASQDIKKRASVCYVVLEVATNTVVGYYTLAASSIQLTDLPEDFAKRFPRYPIVPVARLGRLAIDNKYKGRRLGGALLWDAITKAEKCGIGVFALVVDAKDDQAQNFYRHHGFIKFGSIPNQLIFPINTNPPMN